MIYTHENYRPPDTYTQENRTMPETAEPKQGKWNCHPREDGCLGYMECPFCFNRHTIGETPYCPFCGAEMSGYVVCEEEAEG